MDILGGMYFFEEFDIKTDAPTGKSIHIFAQSKDQATNKIYDWFKDENPKMERSGTYLYPEGKKGSLVWALRSRDD